MIVVWRGRGQWVIWSLVLSIGAIFFVLNVFHIDTVDSGGLMAHHAWPFVVPLMLSGAVCVWLGIDNYGHERGIDPLTGLAINLGPRHSFYGLALQYWGAVYFIIAGVVLALSPF